MVIQYSLFVINIIALKAWFYRLTRDNQYKSYLENKETEVFTQQRHSLPLLGKDHYFVGLGW